ncbi:conserved hypothetical protein [Leishmania mexicana MHOM/GT/2001/U1103]|uniref:EF-hand domain-containing protein n=1 Tax=Leishmania mexicana (strain MHOM/GT/2001/U1103) TaxID=929439 RepID=E9AMH1_LEIMU|nr:conserved hypothetical protein [Leishmania mexicana MHOM/GT/2001/U1103]CBZ24126.1 conserved hypothetical protein [Leishmania mexicana MHOM/GT/2001/U1103]
MTDRLREALRALSEVEKAKAELAKKSAAATATSGQNFSTSVGEGRVAPSSAAKAHHPSAAVPPAAVSATPQLEELTSSDGGSSGSSRSGNDVSAGGTVNATSTQSASTATSSWIRNKKPKFWALVNEAGADDVEAGGSGERLATATTASTAAGSAAAASSSTEASPSASTAVSAPLAAMPPTLAGEASPSDAATGSSLPSSAAASAASSATVGARKDADSPSSLKATGRAVTAHSVRISTSVSPFRNRYKRDVAHVLSELLNSDPTLGPQLLGQLSAESRRLLLIMGAASEYFGVDYEEVAEQVKVADTDRDNSISSKEYDAWVRRMADSTPAKRRHAKESQASAGTSDPVLASASASAQGAAAVVTAAPPSMPSTAPQSSSRGASGTSPSVKASSATLSRHRTDMSVDTAKDARACIIGAIQKSAPSAAGAPGSRDVCGGAALAGSPAGSVVARSSPTRASLEGSAANGSRGFVSDAAGGGAGSSPFLPVTPASTVTTAASASIKQDPGYIPWPTYLRIVAAAAPPFLAFGMLDNSTLVLAGGAIDNALSGSLGLSQMAAASLGGVVSGVAGIQVHGLAERYTRAAPPRLTMEQQRSDAYSRATQAGNTLGMVVGLILGMTPLLFMGGSMQLAEQEERDRHHFQREAARSHQRHCKAMEKEEATLRQRLWEEEGAAREALLRGDDRMQLLRPVQGLSRQT